MIKFSAGLAAGTVLMLSASQVFAAGLGATVVGNVSSALGAGGNGVSVGSNATVNVNNANTSTGASGSLEAQVNAGTITSSTATAVVDLSGNTDSLIDSSADLATYDNLVVQARPAITSVTANGDGTVAVGYSQPAKLFGIFPMTLGATMDVNADGTSEVHLPWYSFLYTKNTADVQTAVATAVSTDAAAMATAQGETAIEEQAHLVDDATAAINANVNGSANAAATTATNASSASTSMGATGSVSGSAQ